MKLKNSRNRSGSRRKKFRKQVLKRDDYVCQMCFTRKILEVHHIKSYYKYPELRWKVSNGISLCHKCHRLTERLKLNFKRINNKWKIIGLIYVIQNGIRKN